MKRIALSRIAIVLLLFLFSCKSQEKKEEVSQQKTDPTMEVVASKKVSKFNLKPVKPTNGKLKGVVELGASGFNSFIVDIDKDSNWEVKKKEFGASLVAEGMTNAKEVNIKLKDYIQGIIEYGVAPEDIHFVVSSGAAKENITKIVTKELKNISYVVNTVTPEQEGLYALKSVLPKRFSNTAFVVDLGSGNTKISYLENDKSIIALETHGAKYFQKKTENETMYEDVKTTVAKVPSKKPYNASL